MLSWVMFKISASLVKPTRETLLDYCSYCLVIIALIGVARVWIGGGSLKEGCTKENSRSSTTAAPVDPPVFTSGEYSGNHPDEEVKSSHDSKNHNDFLLINSNLENHAENMNLAGSSIEECAKYYQTAFAYVLFIESSILLFSGLLWTKVPKVTHTLKRFIKVVRACEKSNWAKKALTIVTDKSQTGDISQSLYSMISSEYTNSDMKSLLDTLFHPSSEYKAKASARHLYEQVQTFCDNHCLKCNIWMTYIIKSLLQFGLWIIIFNINVVLFVVLEFYIMCPEDSTLPCNHDTFLRIIWFMGQAVLLIYAVFNCKTLKWINEKSVVRGRSCCNDINCFKTTKTLYTNDDEPWISCRPYRFADNNPVYNDAAILLYLLEEAHPKVLPYFVIFMFPEWKEKLTSFAYPVQIPDTPAQSSMQMLSGRPPPIIEITDIPSTGETEERTTLPKRKHKNSVTFYIDGQKEGSNKSSSQVDNLKVFFERGGSSKHPSDIKRHSNWPSTSEIPGKHRKEYADGAERTKLSCGFRNATSDSGCYGATSEDTDELAALVHRSISSDSLQSSERSEIAGESDHTSDVSETNMLLA